jgi:hypothetical protein
MADATMIHGIPQICCHMNPNNSIRFEQYVQGSQNKCGKMPENTKILGRPWHPTLISALCHLKHPPALLILDYCAQKLSNTYFDLHLVTHMIDDGTSTLLHTCVATKIL